MTYAYDNANRLTSATDWADKTVSYGYDDAGRKTSQTNPNSTGSSYGYDTAGRLITITHTGPGGTMASFTYTPDSAGNPLSAEEQISLVPGGTIGYAYDRLGRLTTVTYPGPEQVSYQYDPMGNRTQLVDGQGTSTYSYDTSDRLLWISGAQSLVMGWDLRGNQTGKGTQTFGYDAANRLTTADSGQHTASYSYNGAGVRVGKTVDSVTTIFLQDQATSLPHVLVETTASQDIFYVYGLGLAFQVNPDGARRYYHTDALGSTRVVTDDTGQVVSGYNYDAYGAVRAQAGEGRSFTYTGEQLDAELSFLFLRARYFDPATGRFVQKDALPIANRYAYANGNPTRYTDPSGHWSEGDPPPWEQVWQWLNQILQKVSGRGNWGQLPGGWDITSPSGFDTVSPDPSAAAISRKTTECGAVRATTEHLTAQLAAQNFGAITPERLREINAIVNAAERAAVLKQALASGERFVNGVGEEYPSYKDPRTGQDIPFPQGNIARVPEEQRIEWDSSEDRRAFIQEWKERGYSEPSLGWKAYDIHHIRPREFGGDNDFSNLVPVERGFHQDEFNGFWDKYW